MNDIGKILSTQALSSLLLPQEAPSPEQQLEFEKRRRDRINSLISSGQSSKSSNKKVNHVSSTTSEEIISRILIQGEMALRAYLTPSDLKIYNYFLNTTHLSYESAVSQQRIADEVGVGPSTISRCLNKLEHLKIIKRRTWGKLIKPGKNYIYRQYFSYQIPSFMFRKDIAVRLHKLFSALSYKARKLYKFIAISLLFANTSSTYPRISSLSEYEQVKNRCLYKQGISTSKCHRFEVSTSKSPPSMPILEPDRSDLHQETQILGDDDMNDSPISDILRTEVTPKLGLTRKGQIFLSAFHDGALLEALDGLKFMGRGERQWDFKLFVRLCENYIARNRHSTTLDFNRIDKLYKQYGCRENTPFYYPENRSAPQEYIPDKFTEPKKSDPPKLFVAPQSPNKSIPDFSNHLFAKELQALAIKMRLK